MKKILYILILISLIFASCSKDNEVFDEASYDRMESVLKEYDGLLKKSVNGWKMQYFPNADRFGGFNFLFKFEENNRVKMSCDFNDTEKISTYKLSADQGPVLSFDTYNFLHVLADPEFNPRGIGFEGDYEMIIERVTNDSIICKGRKWKQPMVFVKADSDDWSVMDKIRDSEEKLSPSQENVPFFRNLRLNGDGLATFLYERNERFIEYFYNDDDGNTISGKVGAIFSKTGFSLEKEIEVKGLLLKDFVFDVEEDMFTFGQGGTLIVENSSVVEFKGAWDEFYKKVGGSLIRSSKDFYNLFNELKDLEPEVEILQLYWNVQNFKLLSFLFVRDNGTTIVPRWFNSIIYDIDSSGEDSVVFKELIDQETGLPVIFWSTSVEINEEVEAELGAEMNRLFYEDNESSRKMRKILDVFYDPSGFTIIPTDNNESFYMVSKSKSNYWLMFRASN